MTVLYLDPIFAQHKTGRHPENPGRVEAIARELESQGLVALCSRPPWQPSSSAQQLEIHTSQYLQQLQDFAQAGGGQIEQDTIVSPLSWNVTQIAAGAACDAVDRVLANQDKTAFCVIRPPGHHALKSAAMGFCLLNNVAIAARYAVRKQGLDRVLIVDWDVHHGNGTQAIFYDDPQVAFYSIHRWPFYPGTGDSHETGTGAGLGTTKNVPISYGTSRTSFLETFASSLQDFADDFRPDLILVSAGFDAHRRDPVGSLGLETEDFEELTKIVQQIANNHCQDRIISVLEGGYDHTALAQSAAIHLRTLMNLQPTTDDQQ